MKRIAVIGSGIAGLAAARGLAGHAQVTLYEAADHFGGHAHTVDVSLDGRTHGVDTGFVVFDEVAAPKLAALLAELGVATAAAEMSFSAQIPRRRHRMEQRRRRLGCSPSRRTCCARRSGTCSARLPASTATRPRWRARRRRPPIDDSVGDFLAAHRFSKGFRDWYLLPLLGCIWSCPTEQMLRMPAAAMARFCARSRPAARPAPAARAFGPRRRRRLCPPHAGAITDARLATPVRRVKRLPIGGADVSTDRGTERFDAVVFACHSVDTLALLADPSADEREVLGAFHYQRNRAILHTDVRVLPLRPAAWAAWNYEAGRDPRPKRRRSACTCSSIASSRCRSRCR